MYDHLRHNLGAILVRTQPLVHHVKSLPLKKLQLNTNDLFKTYLLQPTVCGEE